MKQHSLRPNRRAAAGLLAFVAFASAACVKQKPPGVAIKSLKSSIVFGLAPPAAPPSAAPPIDATDLGFPDLASPPKLPALPPAAPALACRLAGITDAPAKVATTDVQGQPQVGQYRWKVGGSVTLGGTKIDLPPGVFFNRNVINVTAAQTSTTPVGGDPVTNPVTTRTFSYTMRTELSLPGAPSQGKVDTTYQVKDHPLALNVGTSAANIGKSITVGDPERGITLQQIEYRDDKNQVVGTFAPNPGVLMLPLNVNPGEQYESVGVDPNSGTVLVHDGTVVKRQFVDACGDLVDGWLVQSRETFIGGAGAYVAQYDYIFATQLGGMLIYEKIGPPDLANTPLPTPPVIPGAPTPNIPSPPTTLPALPVSLPGTDNTYEYTLGQLTPSPLSRT
jgi:hypothetical protein